MTAWICLGGCQHIAQKGQWMQLQVDQHVESLHLSVSEQDHVTLAGQLARKGVRPRKLYLHSGGTCHALIALLTEEQQHHRLFQRVGKLRLVSALSSELLQVRAKPPT
jgi:hypothetical protein